jgi:hypothetical protein
VYQLLNLDKNQRIHHQHIWRCSHGLNRDFLIWCSLCYVWEGILSLELILVCSKVFYWRPKSGNWIEFLTKLSTNVKSAGKTHTSSRAWNRSQRTAKNPFAKQHAETTRERENITLIVITTNNSTAIHTGSPSLSSGPYLRIPAVSVSCLCHHDAPRILNGLGPGRCSREPFARYVRSLIVKVKGGDYVLSY